VYYANIYNNIRYSNIWINIKNIDDGAIAFKLRNVLKYNSTFLDAIYPDRQLAGPARSLGKFVESCAKLTCLKVTGYRTKYSTVQCYGFQSFKLGAVESFNRRYVL